MDHEQRRACERSNIGQESETYFLEYAWEGERYRFKPLDTSSGGMGMLVTDEYTEILEKFKVGDQIEMKYCTPDDDLSMVFQIRHITPIKEGPYEGHYQVGLSM